MSDKRDEEPRAEGLVERWSLEPGPDDKDAESEMARAHYSAAAMPESRLWRALEIALWDLPLFEAIVGRATRHAAAQWPDKPEPVWTKVLEYASGIRPLVLADMVYDAAHVVEAVVKQVCSTDDSVGEDAVFLAVMRDGELAKTRAELLARARRARLDSGGAGPAALRDSIEAVKRLAMLGYRCRAAKRPESKELWEAASEGGWMASPRVLDHWEMDLVDSRGRVVAEDQDWVPPTAWELIQGARRIYRAAVISIELAWIFEIAEEGRSQAEGMRAVRESKDKMGEEVRRRLLEILSAAEVDQVLFRQTWGDGKSVLDRRMSLVESGQMHRLGRGLVELGCFIRQAGCDVEIDVGTLTGIISVATGMVRHGLGLRAAVKGEPDEGMREMMAAQLFMALGSARWSDQDPASGLCFARLLEGVGLGLVEVGEPTCKPNNLVQVAAQAGTVAGVLVAMCSYERLGHLLGDLRLVSEVGLDPGTIVMAEDEKQLLADHSTENQAMLDKVRKATLLVRVLEERRYLGSSTFDDLIEAEVEELIKEKEEGGSAD